MTSVQEALDYILNEKELSLRDVLYAIYSLQEYGRATLAHGEFYGARFFINRNHFKGIEAESRKAAFRLINQSCIVCGARLPEKSEYDHLIPISDGGRNSSTNIMPLCKRHNSSKGKKDLLAWQEWWNIWRTLPEKTVLDILCVYAREKYYTRKQQNRLNELASETDIDGLIKLSDKFLPTGSHGEHFIAMMEGIFKWQIE